MSKVEFGVMLRQQKIEFPEIKDAAQLCDKLGYDSVWFYDHVLGQGIIGIDILEPWTLMSALSTVTENIKLGTMVLCNGFRHHVRISRIPAPKSKAGELGRKTGRHQRRRTADHKAGRFCRPITRTTSHKCTTCSYTL